MLAEIDIQKRSASLSLCSISGGVVLLKNKGTSEASLEKGFSLCMFGPGEWKHLQEAEELQPNTDLQFKVQKPEDHS